MCGILSYHIKEGLLKKDIQHSINALHEINYRGPNGEGICLVDTKTKQHVSLRTSLTPADYKCDVESLSEIEDGKYDLLLGHKRLSIFDLSIAGHQPMIFDEGLIIVFNGEVYNFWEIRAELKLKGYSFKSGSDTEVIVKAYKEWGENCLSKFNGMWAIIIYDSNLNRLFVSKDRFGVKPLYQFKNEHFFIYTSEIKQFYAFKNIPLSYNRDTIDVFVKRGTLDFDNSTFFKEIERFTPGQYSLYSFHDNTLKTIPYYALPAKAIKITEAEADEEYNRLFALAISRRLRADVKTGIAISGGVDSSAILYKAIGSAGPENKINTFSAVFPGMEGDESSHIKIIEKDLKDQINVFYTNPYEQFTIEDFERHIYHQDFPTDSASYYAEWSVAKLVRENGVTVLLGGQGGDEVFAGYHQHFYKYCRELILAGKIIKYLSLVKYYSDLKSVSKNYIHRIVLGEIKVAICFKLGLKKFSGRFDTDWLKADTLIEALRLDTIKYQLPWYLRSDDRDFMAFGVETRHPFLDVDLVNFGYRLPNTFKINKGWQKWIIRKNMRNVPDSIRFRKDKKGYTIPQEKFEKNFKMELAEFKKYVRDYDESIAIEKFPFPLAALGIWLKNNKEQ
jgi:asparagine synthase (glutamine-hydrolysing)